MVRRPFDVSTALRAGALGLSLAGPLGCPARPHGPQQSPPPAPREAPSPRARPRPVTPPVPQIVALDAHGDHTCALRRNGMVDCWGKNTYGQLGDLGRRDRPVPVRVAAIRNAVDVRVGVNFSCALLSTGAVQCWGNNEDGQLGNGRGAEVGAMSLSPTTVARVRDVTQIAAGDYHACALERSGTVRCWGHGGNGQIGRDDARAFATPQPIGDLRRVRAIASGAEHVCALDERRQVWCWGRNTEGQLGDGRSGSRIKPVPVEGIDTAIFLASGSHHTCAGLEGGRTLCWGDNRHFELGPGASASKHRTPVSLPGFADLAGLEAGLEHTCGRRRSGRAECWGGNADGQLGHRSSATRRAEATPIRGLPDAVDLALGRAHTCALRRTGEISCWGSAEFGALGPYARPGA